MTEYKYTLTGGLHIEKFVDYVNECENEVFFESTEGDRISLKSTLGQFFFFALMKHPECLPDGSCIRCLGEHDYNILSSILISINK